MMKRVFTLSVLSSLIVSSVLASTNQQPLSDSPTWVQPQRMAKCVMVNGTLQLTTPWIEVGEFVPTGPCDSQEVLVFDHTASANCDCFGTTHHNPYFTNDIQSLVSPSYNGAVATSLAHAWCWNPPAGSEPCIILIFVVESFDVECQDVHEEEPLLEGLLLDYGVLQSGSYYSPVCLAPIGGIRLPAVTADEGNPGTAVLGGYSVAYLQSFDPNTGQIQLASRVQPMLGYAVVGTSTPTQWDDIYPPYGDHTPPEECIDYSTVCTSDRGVLGGAIAFWAAPCQPHSGDVNEDGCVDDADVLAVLFAFGTSGSDLRREDVNCDQAVDDADLLQVLFSFGSGC